jgi:hypothetical protein
LMMGAPGSPTPAPPRGPPSMFLSVDGGRFGITSYDTSRGPAVDILLALRAGAPGSPALAPHGGPGSFPHPHPHSRISSAVTGADKQGPPRGSPTGGTHQSAPKKSLFVLQIESVGCLLPTCATAVTCPHPALPLRAAVRRHRTRPTVAPSSAPS